MRHLLDCGRISKSAGRPRLLIGRTDSKGNKPNRENAELMIVQQECALKGG